MPLRKPRSVQQKMTGIIFLVSTFVLILTSAQFIFIELRHIQSGARDDIHSLARLISTNARFALMTKDYVNAKSIISSLSARKDVVSAYLLLPNGKSEVSYSRSQSSNTRINTSEELKFFKI